MPASYLQVCHECSTRLEFSESLRGTSVACPKCKSPLKVSPDKRLISEDYQRIIRILTFAAFSDGEYDAEEDSIIESFIEKLRRIDPEVDSEEVFREGKKGKHLKVPRSRYFRKLLTKNLVKLVAADGVIDEKEAKFLNLLSSRLKVDRADLLAAAHQRAEIQSEQYSAAKLPEARLGRRQTLEQPISYVRRFLPSLLRGDLEDVRLIFSPMLAYPERTIKQDWDSLGEKMLSAGKDVISSEQLGIFNFSLNRGQSRCLVVQFPWPTIVSEIAFVCIYFKKKQYPALFSFELKADEHDRKTFVLCRYAAGAFFALSDFEDGEDALDFRDPAVFFRLVAASLVDD